MTTDTGISDEMVALARRAIQIEADDGSLYPKAEIRAALSAVAPHLRAQGMREAAALTNDHIEKAMKDGVDAFVAVLLRNTILARAEELEKA